MAIKDDGFGMSFCKEAMVVTLGIEEGEVDDAVFFL